MQRSENFWLHCRGDLPRVRWAASICLERAVEGSDDRYFDASVGLNLEWVHSPRAIYRFGDGFVVDEADVLRPVSSHVRQLLSLMPPSGVFDSCGTDVEVATWRG